MIALQQWCNIEQNNFDCTNLLDSVCKRDQNPVVFFALDKWQI